MNILVVDDSKANRRLVTSMLKKVSGNIVGAGDGYEASQYLKTQTFDLIISDVDMPQMNGICLCKAVRKDESLKHVPIIMLTAHYDNQTRYEAIGAGANAYLTKPVPKPKLIQTVKDVLAVKDGV